MRRRGIFIAGIVAVLAFATLAFSLKKSAPESSACPQGYAALTFDDGPDPITTPLALKYLRENHLHATFFVLGMKVKEFPDLYRQIIAEGHAVGVHTWDHKSLTGSSTKTHALSFDQIEQEIRSTEDAMIQAGKVTPIYWRPPFGDTTPAIREFIKNKFNLIEVGWNVTSRDTFGLSSQEITNNTLTLTDGGTVLLHDTRLNTVNAIPLISAGFAAKGICAGRLAPSHIGTTGWYKGVFYARAVAW